VKKCDSSSINKVLTNSDDAQIELKVAFTLHPLWHVPERPVANFINVKHAHFLYERLFSSYVLALIELLHEKFASLTLVKLTIGVNLLLQKLLT